MSPSPQRPRLWARGSPWLIVAVPVAIALGAVGAIASKRNGWPVGAGAVAGAVAGALGVLALPSIPTRRVVVVLLGLGGLGALRHASFAGSDTSPLLVCWAAATLVALLLVDRAEAEQMKPLPGGERLARRGGETARVAVAIGVIVAVAVVALGPVITDHLGRHVWPGLDPGVGDLLTAPSSLRATDEIDMTARPRLSDRVVFTVDAPRAEFWRGETFDIWNGHAWTKSDPQTTLLPRAGNAVAVSRDPYDIGAFNGPTMRQTFHVETGFSNVIFAAPSPVAVQTDKILEGHADGTATVDGGFGQRHHVHRHEPECVVDRGAAPSGERAARAGRRTRPVRRASGHDRAGAGARAPDHGFGFDYLRQDSRDGGVARRARAVLARTRRSRHAASTSSTTSSSARASAGANRWRAVSS